MSTIFHSFIYQPLYNILIGLYDLIPGNDFGVAIVAFTLLLRLAIYPINEKQLRSQKELQELQPKLKALQEKYKNDKERQTKEMMELYRTHKVNPFGGCLLIIPQILFFFAIYRIIMHISAAGLATDPELLYPFVSDPGKINNLFLGLVDLSQPFWPFAVLAAAAQFYQTKMMMGKKAAAPAGKDPDFAQIMNKQMLFLGPVLILTFGFSLAAGLSLYWAVSTLFAIVQQWHMEWAKAKKDKS